MTNQPPTYPSVPTPRKILVVTDLGRAGATALRAGAAQARAVGASLAVVHAVPSFDMSRPIFNEQVVHDALLQAEMPRRIRAALDEQLLAATADGPPAEVIMVPGRAVDVALETADRWHADLIVIGAPDDGGVEAERVVRHAAVPVLVARPGPERGPVIACTDFSDPALPAVQTAVSAAAASGDQLEVLHVLEPIPLGIHGVEGYGVTHDFDWLPARRAAAERRLADATGPFGPHAITSVLEGPVASTLVDAARSRAARLLVVGTVGRTGLTRFLLGSVAESVVRTAPCSTLVVRLHRHR